MAATIGCLNKRFYRNVRGHSCCGRTMRNALIALALALLSACSAAPKLYLKSGDISMEVQKNAPYVTAVAFAPDGKSVISGGADGTVRRWDLSGETMKFNGQMGWLTDLSYSPDGRTIASVSLDGAIRIWDAAAGRELKQIPVPGLGNRRDRNQNVRYLSDGKHIFHVGQGWDRYVASIYDVETGGKVFKEFSSNNIGVLQESVISPDGKAILMPDDPVAFKGRLAVALKDLTTGNLIWKTATGESVDGVGYTANGNQIVLVMSQIVSGNETRTGLVLLDAKTGSKVKEFPAITLRGSWMNYVVDRFVLSQDGKFGLTGEYGGNYRLWDVHAGRMIRQLTVEEKGDTTTLLLIRSAGAFSPDGRTVVIADRASVRLFDVSTGKEIVTMISFEDDEWLMITPEGYYSSSEKGAQYLNIMAGDQTYEIERFYDVFYRPDIVAAKLRGEDIRGLVTLTMKDAIKSPPPDVEFTAGPSGSDSPHVRVCYKAKNSGGGIGEVRLFQNGKLVQSDGYYRETAKISSEQQKTLAMNSKAIYDDMRSVLIKGTATAIPIVSKSKGNTYENCSVLDAVPGENEVSVAAFNSSNTVQSALKTIKFSSSLKRGPSHLYILAIGIDQYLNKSIGLKYAVKDARDIEEKIKQKSATIYAPQNIHTTLLANNQATKAAIMDKINELTKIIQPTDSFILFVAGHGVLLQNQYYMLTHDYNDDLKEANAISSNEIVEISKRIKSLLQLFIFDTCHAGGVDTIISGLYDARMSVLAKKMGLHIFASANSMQEAQDGYKGNGIFTHALLDGLNNNKEADKNKNGLVTVVGLGEYAKSATISISKNLSHIQTPFIINFGQDTPLYKLP